MVLTYSPRFSVTSRPYRQTGRAAVANAANEHAELLRADGEDDSLYSKVIDIDLNTLEPHLSMNRSLLLFIYFCLIISHNIKSLVFFFLCDAKMGPSVLIAASRFLSSKPQ